MRADPREGRTSVPPPISTRYVARRAQIVTTRPTPVVGGCTDAPPTAVRPMRGAERARTVHTSEQPVPRGGRWIRGCRANGSAVLPGLPVRLCRGVRHVLTRAVPASRINPPPPRGQPV